MNSVRLLAGLAVLALAGMLFVSLLGGGQRAQAGPRAFSSSSECQSCHEAEYAEWSTSEHANSWTGPDVRRMSNDFANQDCIDCHAPLPIFETGIGERVLPRTIRRIEGVDCIACHQHPDGGMAGSFTDPTVTCRPTEQIELIRPEFCAGCHNQHLTMDQWKSSRYAEQGITCIDCHMPYREGNPAKGRDHSMHGGTSLENLQGAVDLRGSFDEQSGGWVLELENVGAGHSFPTDERSRAGDVFFRRLNSSGQGEGPWSLVHRLRSPYRSEVDVPDTLLLVHENRRIPLIDRGVAATEEILPNDAPGEIVSDSVEVLLIYKRSPYYPGGVGQPLEDEYAVEVHRIRLER